MFNENRLTPERIAVLQNFVANSDILLMGVTGVGKTTFVEHLQRNVKLRYVSLGNIVRSEIEYSQNRYIAELMHNGGVWPFEAIRGLLKPYIEQPTPYVLDGIPKHQHEAEWLVDHAYARAWPMVAVILKISIPTAEQRRLESLKHGNRPETSKQIQDRVVSFVENEAILIKTLNSVLRGIIELDVNGITPVTTVNMLADKLIINQSTYA